MATQALAIKRITITNVRGADLPADWAKQAGVDPDQEIDVVIQDRQAATRRLTRLLDVLGAEAEVNGLTEELLDRMFRG